MQATVNELLIDGLSLLSLAACFLKGIADAPDGHSAFLKSDKALFGDFRRNSQSQFANAPTLSISLVSRKKELTWIKEGDPFDSDVLIAANAQFPHRRRDLKCTQLTISWQYGNRVRYTNRIDDLASDPIDIRNGRGVLGQTCVVRQPEGIGEMSGPEGRTKDEMLSSV